MKREVDYHWHLAELMAREGLHNSSDLSAHLQQRGITLSPSQVYRLVTQRPERASLKIVAVVELDDRTHNAARDEKRDAMLHRANYRVVRWHSKKKPSEVEIRARIAGAQPQTAAVPPVLAALPVADPAPAQTSAA